jgi:hypothetical protein
MERKEGANVEIVKEGQNEPIEVFENDIDMHIKLFCNEQNIKDLRAMPQSVWNGCLMFVRKNVFPKGSNRLKDNNIYSIDNNNIRSNFNRYNYSLVNDVLDIYIYYCTVYDKEISIIGFSNLTGIDTELIHVWKEDAPGSPSFDVYKKLCTLREESLSNKLATGNKNPVGILAILNRHYAWNLPGVSRESDGQKRALSVEQLPKLGQIEIKSQDVVVDEQ